MHGAATHRDGPHGEGHDVSGAGDGDADAGVAEAVPQPLRQAPLAAVRLALEVVDALHDHEHVVNTDTCNTTLLHYVDYSILCKYEERRQSCVEACLAVCWRPPCIMSGLITPARGYMTSQPASRGAHRRLWGE